MENRRVYDVGYFSDKEYLKLREIFDGETGRAGIVVSADPDYLDPINTLVTISSDKFNNTLDMVTMFSNILAIELLTALEKE